MSREAFLQRVRQAVDAGRRYQLHLEPPPISAGYVGAGSDVCASLAAEVALLGGKAQVLDSWPEARQALRDWLQSYQPRSVICWEHPSLEKLGLQELLAELKVASHTHRDLASLPPEQQREVILAADIGISSTQYAIAETGSLAVASRPGQERVVSLVPPVHIAVVERAQILPDLFDLFGKLTEQGLANLPSNIALISGPSKTGDIELELTTGVHGPGQWHVLIVRS